MHSYLKWQTAAMAAGLLVSSVRTAAAEDSPKLLNLAAAIERALDDSPDLASARAGIDEARGELRAARALLPANPEVDAWQATRTDVDGGESTDRALGISQELDLLYERGSRVKAARARLAGAEANLDDVRGRVVADVRGAFFSALASTEKLRFANEVVDLMGSLATAAKRREEAGSGTALETNLAFIEAGDAKRTRLEAQRELARRVADLGRLTLLPSTELEVLEGQLKAPPERTLSLEDLRRRARDRSPALKAAVLEKEAAAARLSLARKEALPHITVRAGWEREAEREEIVGLGLSVPIPLFARNQAQIGTARGALRRAESGGASALASFDQEVALAFRRWEASREELGIFDTEILDRVEENLRLLQASLEAGKANLFDVLVVQRRLVETRRDHLDALAEAHAADAEIHRLLGTGDSR